ncbi:MAG: hypothetical protein K2I30_02535 [Clostridia bacterium]|nr:hypothetical protein [Clostridia bacterium]
MKKNNANKLVIAVFAVMGAVLMLIGVVIASNAASIGYFRGGEEIYGTVYDYRVSYSSGSRGRGGGYFCHLNCRYIDEQGRNYFTEVQYNMSYTSKERAEAYGEACLNKRIKMYLKNSQCITEIEMKRYPVYLALSIVLPCAAVFVIGVPIVIIKVKERRGKYYDNALPEYVEEHECSFTLDGVFCASFISFSAALGFKSAARQKKVCALPKAEAAEILKNKNEKKVKLYWKGKRLYKNSRELRELLERARAEQKEQAFLY